MSTLNIGLQHQSFKRGDMEQWAEEYCSSAGSMTEIRRIADQFDRYKESELLRLARRLSLLIADEATEEAAIVERTATLEREDQEEEKRRKQREVDESRLGNAGEQQHEAALSILGLVNVVNPRQQGGAPEQRQDGTGGCVSVTNNVTINTTNLTMTSYAPTATGREILGGTHPATNNGTPTPRIPRRRRQKNFVSDAVAVVRENIRELENKSVKDQWGRVVKDVIDVIGRRFSRLQLDGRPVQVVPKVADNKIERLHLHLKRIDENYDDTIRTAEHTKKVPQLMAFISSHSKITKYSFSIQKCGKPECCVCSEFRTPETAGLRKLVLQRQPTPRLDPARPGHFLCRNDSLEKYGNDPSALTNLEDLPSTQKDLEVLASKSAQERDKKLSSKFKL